MKQLLKEKYGLEVLDAAKSANRWLCGCEISAACAVYSGGFDSAR